jgi:hypothetical protein
MSLFAVEDVEHLTESGNRWDPEGPGCGVTAQRVSGRTVEGERASNGVAPDLEEAPVTATESSSARPAT